MVRFLLISALPLMLVLSSCGGSSAPASVPKGNAAAGAVLFVHDRCVQCHTVNGVGGHVGPELTQDPVAGDFHLLKGTLQNPPSPMSFVKQLHLTDQQIANLSAFTQSKLKPATRAAKRRS